MSTPCYRDTAPKASEIDWGTPTSRDGTDLSRRRRRGGRERQFRLRQQNYKRNMMILEDRQRGLSYARIAKSFGLCRRQIIRICNDKYWNDRYIDTWLPNKKDSGRMTSTDTDQVVTSAMVTSAMVTSASGDISLRTVTQENSSLEEQLRGRTVADEVLCSRCGQSASRIYDGGKCVWCLSIKSPTNPGEREVNRKAAAVA